MFWTATGMADSHPSGVKRNTEAYYRAPIADMQITLLTGRAHQKHTEGGDFRQATYRAIRQGWKKATSVLLEFDTMNFA